MLLGHVDAGEAETGGLAQLLGGEVLRLVPGGGVRQQALAGEVARGLLEGALVVGERKVHHRSTVTPSKRITPSGNGMKPCTPARSAKIHLL